MLDLGDNSHVTDAGLAHLAELAQLQRLDLKETAVVGPGLEHLAGLSNLSRRSTWASPR